MLRAMDAAVAGLRAHQGKMDVLSNNIANVNTFGFKAQSYSFKDTLYHTTNASAEGTLSPTATDKRARTGGTNAAQYGYGSLTGSIATDFTVSTPSYVGGFNAAINGSGFFITSQQNHEAGVTIKTSAVDATTNLMKEKDFLYTRVGQFNVDSNGMIVDTNGNFVYGFRPNTYINPTTYGDASSESGQKLVPLRAPSASKINEKGFLDAEGNATACEDDDFAELPAVQIKGVEIGHDGVIKATVEQKISNGGTDPVVKELSVVIGKVAIASFQNEEGLMKAGNNTFTTASSDNTGNVTASEPGVGATPTLMAGYLENSNVDLAKEFTDMITSQRGFQANSKVITVSDEILQELVNMKR